MYGKLLCNRDRQYSRRHNAPRRLYILVQSKYRPSFSYGKGDLLEIGAAAHEINKERQRDIENASSARGGIAVHVDDA